MNGFRHLGATQQRLLRHLLQAQAGIDVETLCERLRISHNAVRQHLTALTGKGWVGRSPPRATGGRPQARFCLTELGRDLFPRNYAQISNAMLDGIVERFGQADAMNFLTDLGKRLGAEEKDPSATSISDATSHLAACMDSLGYEVVSTQRGDEHEIEAFNCVFHALATRNPGICKFDLAFMEAASGHRVHHMECIVRGGGVCRFRIGEKLQEAAGTQAAGGAAVGRPIAGTPED